MYQNIILGESLAQFEDCVGFVVTFVVMYIFLVDRSQQFLFLRPPYLFCLGWQKVGFWGCFGELRKFLVSEYLGRIKNTTSGGTISQYLCLGGFWFPRKHHLGQRCLDSKGDARHPSFITQLIAVSILSTVAYVFLCCCSKRRLAVYRGLYLNFIWVFGQIYFF